MALGLLVILTFLACCSGQRCRKPAWLAAKDPHLQGQVRSGHKHTQGSPRPRVWQTQGPPHLATDPVGSSWELGKGQTEWFLREEVEGLIKSVVLWSHQGDIR